MPSEVRTITFKQAEVISALSDYRSRKGKPLPKGKLFRVAAEADPSVHVAMAIAVDGEDRLETFDFQSEEVGASLVMFCMKHNIPLPSRDATKGLQIAGDCVALVVKLNAGDVQLSNHIRIE